MSEVLTSAKRYILAHWPQGLQIECKNTNLNFTKVLCILNNSLCLSYFISPILIMYVKSI